MGGVTEPSDDSRNQRIRALSRNQSSMLQEGGEVTGFASIPEDAVQVPVLRSGPLLLRPLRSDDEPAWRRLMSANRDELSEIGTNPVADFGDYVSSTTLAAAVDLDYRYAIFENDILIGEAVLHDVRRGNLQSAFFSMWLDAAHRGGSRVQLTFLALLKLAFEHLGLHRVEALSLPDNTAVVDGLSMLGVKEGSLEPRIYRVNGEWRDHLRYVVDADDWSARREEWVLAWQS